MHSIIGIHLFVFFLTIRISDDDNNPPRWVTQQQYYAYHLHFRSDELFKTLHRSGRLFQEYIVDAYAQIDQSRLRFLRDNQHLFRIDVRQGLTDAIVNGVNPSNIGRQSTLLPSSYIGGPRHNAQLYHDSMAIIRARSKPDLFITVTCNSQWPEIKAIGDNPQDRPDVVARVFKMKLDRIMKDLTKDKIFGKVTGWTYVIEYQKRGNSHSISLSDYI